MEMVIQYLFFKRSWNTISTKEFNKSKKMSKHIPKTISELVMNFCTGGQNHILAAAMEILNIDSLDEIPEGGECDWMLPDEDRKKVLQQNRRTLC